MLMHPTMRDRIQRELAAEAASLDPADDSALPADDVASRWEALPARTRATMTYEQWCSVSPRYRANIEAHAADASSARAA